MTWKQAIFLGGAVLILAACSDATAPRGLSEMHRVESARGHRSVSPPTLSVPTTTTVECRSGYSVQVGFADSTVTASVCAR
jgi:hypothetical protein